MESMSDDMAEMLSAESIEFIVHNTVLPCQLPQSAAGSEAVEEDSFLRLLLQETTAYASQRSESDATGWAYVVGMLTAWLNIQGMGKFSREGFKNSLRGMEAHCRQTIGQSALRSGLIISSLYWSPPQSSKRGAHYPQRWSGEGLSPSLRGCTHERSGIAATRSTNAHISGSEALGTERDNVR